MALPEMSTSNAIGTVTAAIGAIGALGTAAFGLVDATKAWGGGVSRIGLPDVTAASQLFAPALDRALGPGKWREVVADHWINGRPKPEQKAIIKSLIRLGLAPDNADALAEASHVDPKALNAAATKLQNGTPLVDADINVLGRLDVSVDAQLDAAFDRAERKYRNIARFLAGVFSVVLALFASWAIPWPLDPTTNAPQPAPVAAAILVGLLAVPLAPIAKDLASSLSAAAQAVKASKGKA